MKIIVNPDIHGRHFWEESAKQIDEYDRVIFLGDYFDPYNFENISVKDTIENFKNILDFKKNNNDKVVLLQGNHDVPYISDDYYEFSNYHCRHSSFYHKEIHKLFNDSIDCFKIAHIEDDVLFSHAGVESGWLENVVKCNETGINEICAALNKLTHSRDGLIALYHITSQRGGRDHYGSCIWADVHDMRWDIESLKNPNTVRKPIHNFKQIFGHTMQAYYTTNGDIAFGKPIEFENCKMLDCAKSFVLDTEKFEIKQF